MFKITNNTSNFDNYNQEPERQLKEAEINRLRNNRQEIVESLLELSTNELKSAYITSLSKKLQSLLNSDIKDQRLTESEADFINKTLEMQKQSTNLPEWEYLPNGWATPGLITKGWDVKTILEIRIQNLSELFKMLESPIPLAKNYSSHNTYMTYAYVLALAAHKKDRISILDWGGGIGDYYIISKSLMPGLEIDYYCKEVPTLCEGGRKLMPDVKFYENEDHCLQSKYDLVLVSSALQYSENWQKVVSQLSVVTKSYLYITRLPIVHETASFVVIQRPYKYGYQTEYMGWFLNRQEFLQYVLGLNNNLVREFLVEERFSPYGAPEIGECRGFLFSPQTNG